MSRSSSFKISHWGVAHLELLMGMPLPSIHSLAHPAIIMWSPAVAGKFESTGELLVVGERCKTRLAMLLPESLAPFLPGGQLHPWALRHQADQFPLAMLL